MDLYPFLKSVLEQDRCAVVLCDLTHTVIYMNPAAETNYAKYGGSALVGQSLLNCHAPASQQRIRQVVDWMAADPSHNIVYTFHNKKQNKDVYMVALQDEAADLIGYYEKHEFRTPETAPLYDLT